MFRAIGEKLGFIEPTPQSIKTLEAFAASMHLSPKELSLDARYGVAAEYMRVSNKIHGSPYKFNGDMVFLSGICDKFGPDVYAKLVREGLVDMTGNFGCEYRLNEYLQGLEESAEKEGWVK